MERLDSKLHQKYTALKVLQSSRFFLILFLKPGHCGLTLPGIIVFRFNPSPQKRKLLDEGLERKREAELKELYDAMKDRISELEKDNDELNEKLADKEDELDKARQEFLEDIRTRDGEILRLKQLLDKKSEKNNSTATGSPGLTPRAILENPTPMAPKSKTPLSHGKLECSRRNSCISGYSFTLTWLEKHGEWSYKPSSLGTLDRIAIDWMRQDIRFSMNMSHMFFQRISRVVTKG
ncbi:hypothetical protein SORBI_3007G184100 [Sorghum bicolor]|uniref:DUF7806 domain-containing protein n=1 Tax=Sorghum bicolor TaxID=4558 RepID=A0A1Z5RAI0_SORBI|nr:hypothetical protein SORBI_3007G184100 [Sorghum bicolor]